MNMLLIKPKEPMELEEYDRLCRRRSRTWRSAAAGALLLAALAAKLLLPQAAETLRQAIAGQTTIDQAVHVFSQQISQGVPVPQAVAAFCSSLDG